MGEVVEWRRFVQLQASRARKGAARSAGSRILEDARMGRMERRKGKVAEREWITIMREQLGNRFGEIDRNWNQFETLRHDVTLGPFAVEIKRLAPANYYFNSLWLETVEQAERADMLPLLSVRLDRQGWKHTLAIHDMVMLMECAKTEDGVPEMRLPWRNEGAFTCTMPTDALCYFLREYVSLD